MNDNESMVWDLCDKLAALGAGREGCRILGTSEPYRRSCLAWELGRHDDARVRLVGKAIEAVVEVGHVRAAPLVIEALRAA